MIWEYLTGTYTGGSPIVSYELSIDDGNNGPFETVIGSDDVDDAHYLGYKTVISDGLTSGTSYRVKYRAKNIHGWGDYSPSGYPTIMYGLPSEPLALSVVQQPDETHFVITWQQPLTTGGTGIQLKGPGDSNKGKV